MAYQTRTRDPLLESHMQAAIRKRTAELVGFMLLGIAGIFAIALFTYSPNDPNFFNAPSGPIENQLGSFGATISAHLIFVIGWASWCIPLSLIAWGLRLIFHAGEQRWLWRSILIPIFITITAVFLATHAPAASWAHTWSMGGVAGDAILELLIDFNPLSIAAWIRVLSLTLGILTVWSGLFALGFSWVEVKRILKYSWLAIVLTYSGILTFFMRLFQFGNKTAAGAKAKMEERRIRKDGMPVIETKGRIPEEPKSRKQMGRKTLFPTLPVFGSRKEDDTPDLPKEEMLTHDKQVDADATRVQKRIAEVIRKREEPPMTGQAQPEEPMNKISAAVARANQRREPAFRGPSVSAQRPQPTAPKSDVNNVFEDETAVLENPTENDAVFESAPRVPVNLGRPKSVVQNAPKKPVAQSKQAKAEAQPNLFSNPPAANFETPALNLLASASNVIREQLSNEALEENARMLENVLDDYGVKGEIVSVRPGPVVTMYELEPAPGLKASRVIGLSDDIARSMSALAARVSTVPGRTVIGIELPNEKRETVFLREILSARGYGDGKHNLPLALGKDIGGRAEIADLAKMPHLLIAGTTGSGKSVAINTMILSLLYKLSPEECRLIMIDPKMLELSVYDGIPHLLSPVVTDPKKAVVALKWVVGEMEERYRKMSKMGVRNINGYNGRVEEALAKGENFERTVQTGFAEDTGEPIFETETITPEKLPFIVVIVDEMADLMMVAGKEIEACIQRLAQMARASGIHLIMATQRPSVDVITGTIKANFPTRISFQVTSKIDSRTILGEMGAEQLLGMGDMLYMAGGGKITRIHAPFVSDEEVEVVVNHLKMQGAPEYVSGVVQGPAADKDGTSIDEVLGLGGNTDKENAQYDEAVQIVARDRKCSTSYIQRKLSIGYNKAAKLVEEMEENGVVSPANHVGKREILLPEH
ncbi:cell division protein FtsK [Amylibacter kogurei]|uniref:DNA translocase FtsK n=1 Tax=Paramylibacter kogurei TaxID=1889778 RepID=A0A2G5K2W6_9RHOB|nr:DNA translocase FtsK [Amylibacter kogurei]PIB23074.1 cell division protein FtsK [Amylibacter kogurei]